MLDELRAQRADVHPGAGAELEVFRDAAAEKQSCGGIGVVSEHERVAQAVVALFVERSLGDLGLAPIAGRDMGALEARFVAAVHRHELHVHSGRRHAHVGRIGAVPGARNGERRRLGRAEAGEKQDLLAAGLVGELAILVEDVLRYAGAGEPQRL